jgi:hypothetical protein
MSEKRDLNLVNRTGPIINKAYIEEQERLEVKHEFNGRMAKKVLKIGLITFVVFNIITFLFSMTPMSDSGQALELAKAGTFDPKGETFDQEIQDVINQRKDEWASFLNDEEMGGFTRVDAYSRPSDKYYGVSYDQAPENIRPQFEVSSQNWQVQSRTGDGDKTPAHYVLVIGKAHLNILRPKTFNGNLIKVSEEDIIYGPFLVDTEHKMYAYSSSTGALYEDFYNTDVPDEWKHYN